MSLETMLSFLKRQCLVTIINRLRLLYVNESMLFLDPAGSILCDEKGCLEPRYGE